MIYWVLLALAAVIASEVLLRLPLMVTIRKATAAAGKSRRLLRSKRISDQWKERMLPAYAGIIAKNSVLFFGLLCLVAAPVVLVGMVAPGGIWLWLDDLVRPLPVVALCLVSVAYILLRSRFARG